MLPFVCRKENGKTHLYIKQKLRKNRVIFFKELKTRKNLRSDLCRWKNRDIDLGSSVFVTSFSKEDDNERFIQKYLFKKKLCRLEVTTIPKTPFFFLRKKIAKSTNYGHFTYNHAVFGRLNSGRRIEGNLERILDRRYVDEEKEISLSDLHYPLDPCRQKMKTKDSYKNMFVNKS